MQDKQVIVQCPEPPDIVHVGRAVQVRYEEEGSRVQVDFPLDNLADVMPV